MNDTKRLSRIVITDLFQTRLDFAKKLVPGVRTILIQKGSSPQEDAIRIKKIAEVPLKLAIDCTGVENSIHTAIFVSPLPRFHGLHSVTNAYLD